MRLSNSLISNIRRTAAAIGVVAVLFEVSVIAGPMDERGLSSCCETIEELPPGALLAPPLPTYGRVIGVRDDPLSAYRDLADVAYPHGIPVNEAPFALELLREQRAQQLLYSPPPIAAPIDAGSPASAPPADYVPPATVPIPPAPALGETIKSLLLDAFPSASRGNADWDVLVVELQAVDAAGRAVPFHGTLSATLYGREQEFVVARGQQFLRRLGAVRQIANWTRQVDAASTRVRVGSAQPVARFELPLSRPIPDHDLSIAAGGELTAHVLVPGRGIFTASRSDIPLRRVSEVRDQNLIERGSRFLPHEPTAGRRQPTPFRAQLRSSLRPNSRIFAVDP